MIKYLLALVLMIGSAQAQTVIGFRGKGGAFDEQAFAEYAAKKNATGIILYADQIDRAVRQIKENRPYELYGYSLGAASVSRVLKEVERQNLPKPTFALTVGAYWSTDVDFRKYNIKFENYFDNSGAGQKSPGKHIGGIHHGYIMRYVTDNFGK